MNKRIMRLRESKEIDLDGMTLGELSKSLPDWIKQYGDNAFLEVFNNYDVTSIGIVYESEETDIEFKLRIDSEEQMERAERLRYEQLKAKFEGKTD